MSQLRRSIFNSYNASSAARQVQLEDLVANGSDANATTMILLSSNTTTLEITPQTATFDGYASSVSRSGSTSFGSARLTAGNHQVRFEVTGKNTSSSGYGIGMDSITLNPSGGPQEAEALLPLYASSGASGTAQDMSSYGASWGGNYQVHFPASAVGHYMTFETNYDQWLESNFSNMTYSNALTTGTNPYVTLSSRQTQGLSPSWTAGAQTGEIGVMNDPSAVGQTVRTVIAGAFIMRSGQMMRLKFTAATDAALTIDAATFGPRAAGADAASLVLLYFDNAPVLAGDTDPEGSTASPGANSSVTIPAGYHVWTNWFIYTVTAPSAVDYVASAYVSSGSASVWTTSPPTTQSYRVDGNHAATVTGWDLLPGYATNTATCAVTELATWQDSGTATSQVYDTKMTAPVFNQISWSSSLPTGATITMRVRASANADMSGATAWSAIVGSLISPASLSGVANQRYVQFQATLQAAAPYTLFPTLDDVKITWPGQTAIVELSGYYTRGPDYGIFKVLIDGAQPTRGLEIKLSASGSQQDRTFNFSSTSEVKAMNTGR